MRAFLFAFMLATGIAALAAGGTFLPGRTPAAKAAKASKEKSRSDDPGISAALMQQIAALQKEKMSRTPTQQKIDSQLLYAVKIRNNDPAFASLQSLATPQTDEAGRTVVDITANVSDSFLDRLRADGATIIDALPQHRSVRVEVSLNALETIAGFPEVIFIQPEQQGQVWRNQRKREDRYSKLAKGHFTRPDFAERAARVRTSLSNALRNADDEPNTPGTNTGSVNSEGDRAHEADRARGTFNVNGSGIKIGIMSDGVRGLAEAQGRGDVPLDVIILPGQAGPPEGGEGTAILEIVHDLAPGAQLYFATAFGGTARFAQNIRDLRTAGCDIIVDDVFYSFESPIQDGQAPAVISPTNGAIIAQAVIDVTNGGAEYFSSAGNGGNKNDNTSGVWEGDYFNGGTGPAAIGGAGAGPVHDFNGAVAGGTFNTITSASGNQIVLFWSDPLGGSANDYDLYVTNSGGTLVGASTNAQTGTQDPLEAIGAGANAVNNRIYIAKFSGADRFLHLTTTPNGGAAKLSINTTGQTKGHNTAALAYGVGATPAFVPYPNPFNSSNLVETFSSDGPRRLFFNSDGTPKTPGNFSSTGGELRQKPDITAADGVLVTGAGGFPPGSTFPFRFFGTSASAPHAAAIAGLIKSAQPTLTQAQIRTAINSSAIDIEAPGVDRDSGAGIIMAFGALQASGATGFANLEPGTVSATDVNGNVNGFVEPGERGTLTVQLRNTGLAAATGITATLTSTTPGVTVTPPGTSAYPDIPAGGAANNTTPFEFSISSTAGCNGTITFNLTVTYTGGQSPKVIPITLSSGPSANVNETLDATPPASNPPFFTATTGTQTNRVARTADVSSCANNKANPGTQVVAGALRYDAYTFQNTATTTTCVTISLTATGVGNIQVVAYSPTFNSANPAQNFLGDIGALITTNRTFSVNLPAGQNLVVGVNETAANSCPGCTYNLQVTGLNPPCTAAPGGSLQFSSATYNIGEAGGTAPITVTRTGGTTGSVSVTYNVSNGTAVQGQDYTSPATGTLTFVDGETSKTFNITITNDNFAENDETVNLSLQNVTGSATLGSPSAAVLTIQDNEGIEFGNTTYTVEEGCTAVNVTITRTGDTSSAASVNYATVDGTASARSDYTPAFGRLDFAAGETSKTIPILISEDSRVEGTETFSVVLSNVGPPSADVVVSSGSTTVISITDDAVEPATNPIDDTPTFVCQQYHDFLNREPDAGGQAFWVNNIESCGGDASCREIKRIDTSAAFFLSIEFQQTGYAVYLAYQAAFARTTVPVTFGDFLRDVQRISRGVIFGQPGASALLEANTVAYFNEFVTRSAFTTQFPPGMTPAQYVDELDLNSGGSLSQSERDALVAELTANNTTAGRASVLRKVTDDSDFRADQFNRAFVMMEYLGYLRRDPNDTPDTDYAGYFYWLNKLNSFNGDFRAAEMVKAFIISIEYRQRFAN